MMGLTMMSLLLCAWMGPGAQIICFSAALVVLGRSVTPLLDQLCDALRVARAVRGNKGGFSISVPRLQLQVDQRQHCLHAAALPEAAAWPLLTLAVVS